MTVVNRINGHIYYPESMPLIQVGGHDVSIGLQTPYEQTIPHLLFLRNPPDAAIHEHRLAVATAGSLAVWADRGELGPSVKVHRSTYFVGRSTTLWVALLNSPAHHAVNAPALSVMTPSTP